MIMSPAVPVLESPVAMPIDPDDANIEEPDRISIIPEDFSTDAAGVERKLADDSPIKLSPAEEAIDGKLLLPVEMLIEPPSAPLPPTMLIDPA